jgi:hypothetical protein
VRALGCIKPPDRDHIAKYPATAAPGGLPVDRPVVVGFNWYPAFDEPYEDNGIWRVRGPSAEEAPRGGHCFCFKPPQMVDPEAWWIFYDQGEEGACVGFGNARALSLDEHRTYNAFRLYDAARREEGTYPEGEGSTVREGMAALLHRGAAPEIGEHAHRGEHEPDERPQQKINAYRWITDTTQLARVLGLPEGASTATFLNSWGKSDYPHETQMDLETFDRLLGEEGEAGVFTVG